MNKESSLHLAWSRDNPQCVLCYSNDAGNGVQKICDGHSLKVSVHSVSKEVG